jgi:hypothetical protein
VLPVSALLISSICPVKAIDDAIDVKEWQVLQLSHHLTLEDFSIYHYSAESVALAVLLLLLVLLPP